MAARRFASRALAVCITCSPDRWPPPAVAVCLRLMIALDLSAAEATKFLKMRRGQASDH